MLLILIVVVLLVVGGGGGYYGYRGGYYGNGGFGIIGLLILVLILFMLFGGRHFAFGAEVVTAVTPVADPLNLQPVLQPLLDVAGLVITGLLAIYVPKAITIFEAKTHVQISEQQRQVILGAVQTAAGVVETKLDQGAMSIAQVHIADPNVVTLANNLIAQVPDAAKAMDMTSASVANMIVGAVNTSPKPVVVTNPVLVKG